MEYNEFSRIFKKYLVPKGDKKQYVTHANMKGGSLHVPVSCRHAFLSVMADSVRRDRRPSLSERAMRDSNFRTLFFDLDAQSTDRNHVFLTKTFYYDIVTRYIIPALYECYSKEAIVAAKIKICIAFPNCIREKERVDACTIRYKFGAHIRCLQKLEDGSVVGGGPYITVDNFDVLRQIIVTNITNDTTYDLSHTELSDLFDLAPFQSGGMRMLLNVKGKKKCKMHLDDAFKNECEYCNGTGEIADHSFYSPERLIDGEGKVITCPWGNLSTINEYCRMWKLTSINVPFTTLSELYEVFLDETQKLHFHADHHYRPSANIRERVAVSKITGDDGLTIHVNKRMKVVHAPLKSSSTKGELLPNVELKEAMEAWIWANFSYLFCNPPPQSSQIAKHHRTICHLNMEYLHVKQKWDFISTQLGLETAKVKQYWKQCPRVQVQSVVRSQCDNYRSVIWVSISGPLAMRCGNAAGTNRSKEYEHDSASRAYFQFQLKKNEVTGMQRCHANNKGAECKNSKKCKTYKSKPHLVPSWMALGLFVYRPANVQCSSAISTQGMIQHMNLLLNKDGRFRSMKKIDWNRL